MQDMQAFDSPSAPAEIHAERKQVIQKIMGWRNPVKHTHQGIKDPVFQPFSHLKNPSGFPCSARLRSEY
jgi:hypothetical protein